MPAGRANGRRGEHGLLQVLGKKPVRRLDHLIKPDLFAEKRMRRTRDDSQSSWDIQLTHPPAKGICLRAGIVPCSGNEPAGRVLLVEMMQWRRAAISGRLFLLRAAQELSPDPAAIFDHGDLARALRQQICLRAQGHGRLNRAADVGMATIAFQFLDSV